jgi:hypothetical protein
MVEMLTGLLPDEAMWVSKSIFGKGRRLAESGGDLVCV